MYELDKPDNLVEIFEDSVKKYANNLLFGTKNSSGTYEWVTYSDVSRMVDGVRSGLVGLVNETPRLKQRGISGRYHSIRRERRRIRPGEINYSLH